MDDFSDLTKKLNEDLNKFCLSLKTGAEKAITEDEVISLRKGAISFFKTILYSIKNTAGASKKHLGATLNQAKAQCMDTVATKLEEIKNRENSKRFLEERQDLSIDPIEYPIGRTSSVQNVVDNICQALTFLGFAHLETQEIEDDYHNFLALNFPENHPAREMQDTCYVDCFDINGKNTMLRTHTSNAQIRCLEAAKDLLLCAGDDEKALAVVSTGKCFRNEEISCRSHMFFHQIEIFFVKKGTCYEDLNVMIEYILSKIFHGKVDYRLRSSYFPFVEPGIEADVQCFFCKGDPKGCSTCKYSGWLEILGAGMINNKVLDETLGVGHNFTGYALGIGIERLVMLIEQIKDIRDIHSGKICFLNT